MTRVLVWQWGRRGGAPRFAALLAEGLRAIPGTEVALSLSSRAELLHGRAPPHCDLTVDTYGSLSGFLMRALLAPLAVVGLANRIRALRPDLAICSQPGPLDLLMAAALRLLRLPFVVVVHDAKEHPGDWVPFQLMLQALLCRCASCVVALSTHVADRLRAHGLAGTPGRPLLVLAHPPITFGAPPPPPLGHGGPVRLLSFGRLLPYKGLDLLAAALTRLAPQPVSTSGVDRNANNQEAKNQNPKNQNPKIGAEIRVVGQGPESPSLAALRALPDVTVENRWVPEDEVGALLGWADAVILTHTEASQSGVAAAALAAGRRVVATRVGGLIEQLQDEPLATLCPPEADALATALRGLIAAPVTPHPPVDAPAAWRDMAASLLRWTMANLR